MKPIAMMAVLVAGAAMLWIASAGEPSAQPTESERPVARPGEGVRGGPWERLSLVQELPPGAERRYEELLRELQEENARYLRQIEESRDEIARLLQQLRDAVDDEQRADMRRRLEERLRSQHELELGLAERRLRVTRMGLELALRRYIEAEVNLREVRRKIELRPRILRRQFHRGRRGGEKEGRLFPRGESEPPSSDS